MGPHSRKTSACYAHVTIGLVPSHRQRIVSGVSFLGTCFSKPGLYRLTAPLCTRLCASCQINRSKYLQQCGCRNHSPEKCRVFVVKIEWPRPRLKTFCYRTFCILFCKTWCRSKVTGKQTVLKCSFLFLKKVGCIPKACAGPTTFDFIGLASGSGRLLWDATNCKIMAAFSYAVSGCLKLALLHAKGIQTQFSFNRS